jgi:hypothetical protein
MSEPIVAHGGGHAAEEPLAPFPFLTTGDHHHGEEDAEILEQL